MTPQLWQLKLQHLDDSHETVDLSAVNFLCRVGTTLTTLRGWKREIIKTNGEKTPQLWAPRSVLLQQADRSPASKPIDLQTTFNPLTSSTIFLVVVQIIWDQKSVGCTKHKWEACLPNVVFSSCPNNYSIGPSIHLNMNQSFNGQTFSPHVF